MFVDVMEQKRINPERHKLFRLQMSGRREQKMRRNAGHLRASKFLVGHVFCRKSRKDYPYPFRRSDFFLSTPYDLGRNSDSPNRMYLHRGGRSMQCHSLESTYFRQSGQTESSQSTENSGIIRVPEVHHVY